MHPSSLLRPLSTFMRTNLAHFLQRFSVSYYKEDTCIEYFINRCGSTDRISSALLFSYSALAKKLHVSRFHPELYRQPNSKYLSAACFYLLIHHCADSFSLDDACLISLQTVPMISDRFYMRLRDFNFCIRNCGLVNSVELNSSIIRLSVDTSMIKPHAFGESEIPLLR